MNHYQEVLHQLTRQPRRWLVTGAAGFIGSHLMEALLNLDQDVVALDNFATGKRENLEQVRQSVGAQRWQRLEFIEGDIRSPHDHPVLRPVVVELQGQLGARIHGDALDPEALAAVDVLVAAPGAMDAARRPALVAVLGPQLFDHLLHPLRFLPRRHQQGIAGFDDDQIPETDADHHAMGGMDVAVRHRMQMHVAVADVAGVVLVGRFPQRLPGADVAPGEGGRDHRRRAGALQHRVIDGGRAAAGEALAVDAAAMRRAVQRRGDLARDAGQFGFQALQLGQEMRRAEQKDAAVPVVAAAGEEAVGDFQFRLLDEARHVEAGVGGVQGRPLLDVAEAGFGAVRTQAENHQAAALQRRHAAQQVGAEGVDVGDVVVRRQHQQRRVPVGRQQMMGGDRDRRRGAAPEGLDDQPVPVGAGALRLRRYRGLVLLVGDDPGLPDVGHGAGPAQGFLERAASAQQGQELLGFDLPGHGPQPCSRAAAENDRMDVHRQNLGLPRGRGPQ
ncbi:hypothetical protein B9N43_07305 [Denitratisoma sp. DHT3]|nr:hypothetical protein B9N43_07305 [Denitratisoma sp. DHT3]